MGFWFLWITEQVVWPCFFHLYTSAVLSFQQLDISILICRTSNKIFGTRSLQMSICCLLVVQMLGFLLTRFVKKRPANRKAWCVAGVKWHGWVFIQLCLSWVIRFYLYCWIVSFGWNPIHTVMTEKISGCCTQKESHMDHMFKKDVQLRSISPDEPWSGSRDVSHSDRNDQSLAGWVLKQKEI